MTRCALTEDDICKKKETKRRGERERDKRRALSITWKLNLSFISAQSFRFSFVDIIPVPEYYFIGLRRRFTPLMIDTPRSTRAISVIQSRAKEIHSRLSRDHSREPSVAPLPYRSTDSGARITCLHSCGGKPEELRQRVPLISGGEIYRRARSGRAGNGVGSELASRNTSFSPNQPAASISFILLSWPGGTCAASSYFGFSETRRRVGRLKKKCDVRESCHRRG